MTPAEILMLVQLFAALEPPVVALVNQTINAFNDSDMTPEDRMNALTDLAATLKPMVPKE